MTQATTTDLVQPSNERRVTAAEFQDLVAVPAAAEWFANLDNPRTKATWLTSVVLSGSPAPINFAQLPGRTFWPGAPSWSNAG